MTDFYLSTIMAVNWNRIVPYLEFSGIEPILYWEGDPIVVHHCKGFELFEMRKSGRCYIKCSEDQFILFKLSLPEIYLKKP